MTVLNILYVVKLCLFTVCEVVVVVVVAAAAVVFVFTVPGLINFLSSEKIKYS